VAPGEPSGAGRHWPVSEMASGTKEEPGEVLAAMADPTRRRLLEELATRGEATATALAGGLPISRQAVVKHLGVLSRAGLVSARRRGREVRYLAYPDSVAATARWMAGLAADWDRRLASIKTIAEAVPGPAAPGPVTTAGGEAGDSGLASSGHAGELLVGGHDPDAERDQRDRDDLEAGDAQRYADDREAQRGAGHQVP
jgi:DNA-binding transcriptional ArsR family regulator